MGKAIHGIESGLAERLHPLFVVLQHPDRNVRRSRKLLLGHSAHFTRCLQARLWMRSAVESVKVLAKPANVHFMLGNITGNHLANRRKRINLGK